MKKESEGLGISLGVGMDLARQVRPYKVESIAVGTRRFTLGEGELESAGGAAVGATPEERFRTMVNTLNVTHLPEKTCLWDERRGMGTFVVGDNEHESWARKALESCGLEETK